MTERGIRPQPAMPACRERSALAQQALALELSGELDRAVALIRRLQHPDRDAGDTCAVRVRAVVCPVSQRGEPVERRIA
jgi:hypothetical protein